MSTIVFIRTTKLTAAVTQLFDLWSQILPGEVALLVDETAGAVDTGDLPKHGFRWGDLLAQGLPDRPRGQTQAVCADYLMAALAADMAPTDRALVVDAALVPQIADVQAWRAVLDGLGGHDLILAQVAPAPKPMAGLYAEALTASPALFGFTAAAARLLLQRRREIADQILSGQHLHWPAAQVFLPSEARALGLVVADLATLLPGPVVMEPAAPLLRESQPKTVLANGLTFPLADDRADYLTRVGALLTARLAPEALAALLAPVMPLTAPEEKALSDLAWQRYGSPSLERFLPRPRPAPRLYVQARVFDDQAAEVFDLWSKVLPGRVSLLLPQAAETGDRPFVLLATASDPQTPDPQTPETAMATLAPLMSDLDFTLVVQVEAVPVVQTPKAWAKILTQCAEADLALVQVTHRGAAWVHARGLDGLYTDAEIHGCQPFFVGFTAQAARALLARRAALTSQPAPMVFLATEALRLGLTIADLAKLMPRLARGLQPNRPWWWPARPRYFGHNLLVHPVTSDRKVFLTGVVSMIRAKVDPARVASHLAPVLPLTAQETRWMQVTVDKAWGGVPGLEALIPQTARDPGTPATLRLFIRSKVMDDMTAALFDLWSQVLPGQVTILMDETEGRIDTGDRPKVAFDLKDLQRQGLPTRPEDKAAWHCSDYVMAALEPHLAPQDFALVMDAAAVPVIHDPEAWRAALARLALGDLAAADLGPRPEEWRWRRGLGRIYADAEVMGCQTVVLGFTRATARAMTARRLQIAADLAAGLHDQWPHGEAFVATEALRLGLRVTDLMVEMPGLGPEFSPHAPFWWDKRPAQIGRNTLLHPVTRQRETFVANIVAMIRKSDPPRLVAERLSAILPLTDAEREWLDLVVSRHTDMPDLARFLAFGAA
ncbi:hypothetical protein NX862_11605 [Rhodobacter sp. KR11]|uniref:hypothetical protein n=1 Tax=Rhodobacter sp. KR11 TaxID=2974588 RepID=UPI0022213C5D|nr:hypothetical protein [Rhodobacter sp. KR11]MCW1919401.1 hypothetical protein [Rhodobacter sp. KR11]